MQNKLAFNRLLDVLASYKQAWQHYSKVTNPQWGGTIPELQLVIRGELCTIQQEGKDDWEDLFTPASPEEIINQLLTRQQ